MKVVQIVFSPTGGTQKAADAVIEALDKPTAKIDLTLPDSVAEAAALTREDLAVIALPSYGGRVPTPAAQRLSKISGNQAFCILLCVYGNRAYEDTLAEMEDLAKQCGFRVAAAISAVAEHSLLRQYAAGRPDRQDVETLHGYTARILEKLNAADGRVAAPSLPGNRPYKRSGVVKLVPKADKTCTLCGACARKCPAQAISHSNPMETERKKCISCMRCVALCPMSSRKPGGILVSAAALAMKGACSGRKEPELFL